MATGFKKSGGTDLDAVFMAYASGTKAALTGYKNSIGTDLRDLFQPYTQGAAPANVGYKISGGADLSTLFQDINVPLYSLLATTPGGSLTVISNDPSSAVAYVDPHIDGYFLDSDFAQTAYMTATGTNYASGKYWKWNYVSGDIPTSPTPNEDTWTACGTGGVYMRRNPPPGTRTGTVTIRFANDINGNGATTAGTWTFTATVEP